ncbi:MAG: glycosyltransferase family 4 protein, partial [Steroidobacteraceae bacterium]
IAFALPGFHRYNRGAEIAFIAVASELGKAGETVTLFGSGQEQAGTPYRFLRAASVRREHFEIFPSVPVLRGECAYEELTFMPGLLRRYRPADYDVTITCSYPFTNWVLRRPMLRGHRPPHIFVTENGDWPAYAHNSEYRFFGCDGLICTNPDFYERNKNRWRCQLIPNGVDCNHFSPGSATRREFSLPPDRLIVLMVSALIPTKRVEMGIEAVSRIRDGHLVVAGDGPLRQLIQENASRLLPDRITLLSVPPAKMPSLYRSSDVFLHLSKDEPFGNVFLEAMACGLPIVAHDSQRSRWIMGPDQFLVNSDDVAAIAENIELARDAPALRRQQWLNQAANFSWSKIGAMYRQFIQQVIERDFNVPQR